MYVLKTELFLSEIFFVAFVTRNSYITATHVGVTRPDGYKWPFVFVNMAFDVMKLNENINNLQKDRTLVKLRQAVLFMLALSQLAPERGVCVFNSNIINFSLPEL